MTKEEKRGVAVSVAAIAGVVVIEVALIIKGQDGYLAFAAFTALGALAGASIDRHLRGRK